VLCCVKRYDLLVSTVLLADTTIRCQWLFAFCVTVLFEGSFFEFKFKKYLFVVVS
jgi:hypothetical protein